MGSRSRGWCFTCNNPVDGQREAYEWIFHETEARYLVFQLEAGAEGMPHYQGYIYWEQPKTFKAVKLMLPGNNLENARGTGVQNQAYCTKEEGRLAGPYEFGEVPTQGKRNDLDEIKAKLDSGASLKEISQDHFGSFCRYLRGFKEYKLLHSPVRNWAMEITVTVGPSGIGKSRAMLEDYPGAYWKSKNSGQQQFWDGYLGESVIIIDDYYGWFSYDYLLRLCDRYPFSLDSKGGTVQCSAKQIHFTSNKHPRDWYNWEKLGVPGWDTLQSNGVPANPLQRRITRILELAVPGGVTSPKISRVSEEFDWSDRT